MFAPSASSMSPFLHDRIELRPMNTPSDPDPDVRLALGIDQAVVVDHDVVADVNLVRMPQHDVLAEDDVAAARSEERRIQRLSQRESERTRTALRERDDQLVLQERPKIRFPDDERRVFLRARSFPVANS